MMVTVTNTIFCDKMGFKSKIRNLKDCAVNSMIFNNYYDEDIDDNLVYLESRDGLDFTGNIFRITEELSTGKYGDLKIHVHAKPQVVDKIKAYQKKIILVVTYIRILICKKQRKDRENKDKINIGNYIHGAVFFIHRITENMIHLLKAYVNFLKA